MDEGKKAKWRAIAYIAVATVSMVFCFDAKQEVGAMGERLVQVEVLTSEQQAVIAEQAETIVELEKDNVKLVEDFFYASNALQEPVFRETFIRDTFYVTDTLTVVDSIPVLRTVVEQIPVMIVETDTIYQACTINVDSHSWYKPQASDFILVGATAVIATAITWAIATNPSEEVRFVEYEW